MISTCKWRPPSLLVLDWSPLECPDDDDNDDASATTYAPSRRARKVKKLKVLVLLFCFGKQVIRVYIWVYDGV